MFFQKDVKKDDNIEMKVWRLQRWVTYGLFLSFGVLLVINLWQGNNPTVISSTNVFLSIITGWIGIVMGFYFSKGMSSNLERKIKDARNASENTNKNYIEMSERIKKLMIEKEEKYRKIMSEQREFIDILIKDLNHSKSSKKVSASGKRG